MTMGGIFVYVSNEVSGDIFVLRLDPGSGDLALVEKIAVGDRVMPMAVSPDRRFLYASLRTEPFSVASFAIDPLSGRLTHLGNAPLRHSMVYISTDRTGRFLFGAASIPEMQPQSCLISVSPIGLHGFVQPAHQIIRTEPKMHAILPDASNRYVFATSCDGDLILRQRFDAATGKFSSEPLSPVRLKTMAGPRHLVFHPNNRFLYVLGEKDATIYTFGFDASAGALSELQILSVLPPDFDATQAPHAYDLHLTPDGKILYTSEGTSSTLAAFKVDAASGMLTPAGNFPTEKKPRGFNIDPYGRYLLAAGVASHSMTSYAIDRETGNLTKLKEYAMGKNPNWIEIVSLP